MPKKAVKKEAGGVHSFHIQLPLDELRRLRIMAAERGSSAGRLARELLIQAMDQEEGRKKGAKS